MQFDTKDIEAVAKDRVSRKYKKQTNYWLFGAMIALVAGYLVAVQYNVVAGIVICGLGVVAFFYYSNNISKKQNAAKKKLLSEWKDEQRQVQK